MPIVREKDLKKELKVTRPTLLSWRKQGMPHIKKGRLVFYEIDKVLIWLAESGLETGN